MKLPTDYKSDKTTISKADRQAFNEQTEQGSLEKFITSCKKALADHETDKSSQAKPSFQIDQTIKLLEKIAEEDPINKYGIEQLNKTLKSLALENRTKTAKLSKLIAELEKVRDNPERYRNSLLDELKQNVNPNYDQNNAKTGQKSQPKKRPKFEK